MPDVFIAGVKVRLTANRVIGQGGEADIYNIGGGKVVKLYKPPTHPDFQGLPNEQEGARRRIEEIQAKLREFPKGLPDRIVAPLDLVTDLTGGRILGYTMPFVSGAEVLMRFGERKFREQGGISNQFVGEVFRDLYPTVVETHRKGVVFGDFNDLNILVVGSAAFVVDIDSCQFGRFPTRVFTARFVDPLLCDPKATSPMLIRPHNQMSDWYAFAVMYMQSLLYVDPYGGVYRPADPRRRVNHPERPLHRITVFHPEVKYPKAGIPYAVLPDDLLQYFHRTFEKDIREIIPENLLILPWVKCTSCNTEHARKACPNCAFIVQTTQEVRKVTGKVTADTIFSTKGIIVFAAAQNNKLMYLYHENGRYMREGGRLVVEESLDPKTRFRIRGNDTLIGRDEKVRIIDASGTEVESVHVDGYGNLPVFDANFSNMFWTSDEALWRNATYGPEKIGNVLSGQTLFWVGPSFGAGFYRAGNISMSFVFDSKSNAINDNVKLPPIRGQLIDSTAVFTSQLCWFFTSTREGGKTLNRCHQIKRDGTVVASAETEADDGSWLGTIRGKTAAGDLLIAATDEGIVSVQAQNSQISVTQEFPDTEPYVDSETQLFPGAGGLYAVNRKEVVHIKIG